ncbi:MBL fold metallo-hydrolase [uncultured Cohaesibacter sp.]|uniref:MBL fold metallo-hydrolase n=1 Tax=uncultured Cohaesibacter sp. TaxID=1002546 RepID=UPI0029C7A4CC|nr:MBL fold metallo-hydrolase [uncultured Cohaesibacter sp.]
MSSKAMAPQETASRRVKGRFLNPPGSPRGGATLRDFLHFLYQQTFKTQAPEIPDWHVLDDEERDRQLANASNPSVTWLGHASFLIRTGGKVILTDPFLEMRAGMMGLGPKRFVPAALSVEQLPKVDILLMSHNHYDHLDAKTIEAYPYKAETQVIVPRGLGAFFTRRGYAKVAEQDWWDQWMMPGLSIRTLPAVHFSGRGLFDRKKTLWASFAIETGDGKIWFSGDTASGEIFKEVGQRVGPFDYAIVGIGAYEPASIMVEVHATPEEGISIARAVGASKAIGMHWGSIMLTPEDPFEAPVRFRAAAREQGYGEENALILKIGETRSL